MFETFVSNNEVFLDEGHSKVQVGSVSIPKLTMANIPPANFSWSSPKSSDSGETETDDVSNHQETLLNNGQAPFVPNVSRFSGINEDNSFFNIPFNHSELLEIEQAQAPPNVFDLSRSHRNSPQSDEFIHGSSYPPSTHFMPPNYESSHFGNELSYETPMRSSMNADPKHHERYLQHQMMMQQRKMFDHEPKAFPSNGGFHVSGGPVDHRFNSHGTSRMMQQQPHIPPKFGPFGSQGQGMMNASGGLPARGMPMDYGNMRMNGGMQSMYSPYNHMSTGPSMNSINSRIYQVQFKCCNRFFTLGMHAPPSIAVGDFVVVEADRGEDVGVVTDIMPMKTFIERRIYYKSASDDDDNVIGRIIRPASPAERQLLPEKFRDEEGVLHLSRELAYGTYRLPMMIHDVDYQFDRHKLTIFYSSESRIDFREFVRDMFSAYKARIWMKKLNVGKSMRIEQWAAMGLATGMQFSPERSDLH